MEDRTIIKKRLEQLRAAMKRKNLDYYLITSDDYHCSEYVSSFFKTREYFSGFTGSNGNLLVSAELAGLWTDGRYFIQAEKELLGSGISLFRMQMEGVDTIPQYLSKEMKKGQILGFDGRCVQASLGKELESVLKDKKIKILYEIDLAEEIWTDRPELPLHPIWLQDEEKCGRTTEQKLELIRCKMDEKEADYLLVNKLDNLMWLLNARGGDIECNPVFLGYGLVGREKCILFIREEELSEELEHYFESKKVTLRSYCDIITYLSNHLRKNQKVWIDPAGCSYSLLRTVSERTEIISEPGPIEWYQALKTDAELEQIREIYLEDSAVVCKFLYWLKNNIGKIELSEVTAAEKIDQLRSKISDFIGLSFPTICAYRENAAMMHYEATKETARRLETEGMLLVDSGGQYRRGTTDVTRTIALGPVSDEIKLHFSKTAAGMLQLASVRFMAGCCGRNLDILAREPLWELGIDYKCGTGHGIGYVLNVHEGPQSIRWKKSVSGQEAVLEPGMILSDEPGVYKEGSHGIRTENILEVQKDKKNEDGQFLKFGMLTYVPIDRDLIDKKVLTDTDVIRIDAYHQEVYEKMLPFLKKKEAEWLFEVTRPL